MLKFRIYFLLLGLCLTKAQAQNHSFSYASPFCNAPGTVSPATSGNFISGGNFLFTPSGISINGSSGVVNLGTSAPGTYTITYTGAICGCFTNAPVTATIEILASPTIAVSGVSAVCAGNAITFTASGASTYIWTTGAMTSTMSDFPFTNPTTYTVLGTASNGCTGSAVKSVTVIPNPTVSIVANPTVCLGYNYQMTASSAPGASYTWLGPVNNSSSLTAVANTSLTNSASFTVIAAVFGCTASTSHAVQVFPVPNVTIAGNTTVCAGNKTTLFGFGAVTYSWNTNVVADSLQLTPTQSGIYSVIGTDFNGCTTTTSVMVSVFPKPNVSIIGTGTVCEGKPLVLTGNGASTYTWSNGSNAAAINFYTMVDTVVYLLGANPNGCTDSASIPVTVFPTPSVAVTSASSCAGASVQLFATPVSTQTDGIQFTWSASGGTDGTLTVFPLTTTTYTIRTLLGVCSATAVGIVSVTPSTFPIVSFTYAGPYCTGGEPPSPLLPQNFASGGRFYSNQGLNVDPASGLVDLSAVQSGFYSVQYSVEPKGCVTQGVGFSSFKVDQSVKISMPERIEVAPGQTVQLLNSGGVSDYIWSPANGLNCSTCQTPVLTADKKAVYCVTSTQPCSEGSCILIDVTCERSGDFSVPNAFTPNKDGLNEKYCLRGWDECNKKFSIRIFDRWGNNVFESEDPNFCWDGIYNGELLPAGVYVYAIRAIFSNLELINKSGNITLIR